MRPLKRVILLLLLLAAVVLTPLIVLGRRPDNRPRLGSRVSAADFKPVCFSPIRVTVASPIVMGNGRIYVPLPHSASIEAAVLGTPTAPLMMPAPPPPLPPPPPPPLTAVRRIASGPSGANRPLDIVIISPIAIPPVAAPPAVPGFGFARGFNRLTLPGFTTSNTVATSGLLVAWLQGVGVTAVDDLTGHTIWTTKLPAPVSDFSVAAGRVYAGGDGEAAYALDPQTGRVVWTCPSSDRLTTAVGVGGGVACFGSADRSFHVVDAGSGKVRGTLRLDRTPYGRPIVGGDIAYVAAGFDKQRSLCAIDLKRRAVAWSTAVVEGSTGQSPWENIRGPVLDGQTLYLCVNDQVHAYDTVSGKTRWKWIAPVAGVDRMNRNLWPRRLSTPLPYAGAIFVSRHDGVHVLDASSGNLLHHVATAADDWAPRMASDTPPVVWRDVLYFTPDAQSVHGVGVPTARSASTLDPRVLPVTGSAITMAAVFLLLALGVALLLHLRRAWVAAVCVGLCALTVVAWLRSYSDSQFLGTRTLVSTPEADALASRGIASRNGVLKIGAWHAVRAGNTRTRVNLTAKARAQFEFTPLDQDPENLDDSRPGLGITSFALAWQSRGSGTSLGAQSDHSLSLPHAFIATLLAIPPLAWLTGLWRDRRRYPKGHCPQCGYDLRASGDRCPECGAEVVKSAGQEGLAARQC